MHGTIEAPARWYEDEDDCLAAAERDACRMCPQLRGYTLDAQWLDDDERDTILMTVPAHLLATLERLGYHIHDEDGRDQERDGHTVVAPTMDAVQILVRDRDEWKARALKAEADAQALERALAAHNEPR